jgi:hypothetical protein
MQCTQLLLLLLLLVPACCPHPLRQLPHFQKLPVLELLLPNVSRLLWLLHAAA